jgi:hypothetical protein
MEDLYLTQTRVLDRPGWSRTLLTRFLGEPDKRKKVYRRSIPLALYSISRVDQAEASPEFQAAQAALSKRKEAAESAVYTKKSKLLEAVQSMPINVQVYPIDQVRKKAIITTLVDLILKWIFTRQAPTILNFLTGSL